MKAEMDQREKDLRIEARECYRERMKDIRAMWKIYHSENPEEYSKDGARWDEYGLSFDYVGPGTFSDQRRGYFRYQISYGGPSEEFRFYTDEKLNLTGVYFWFLNWFTGHGIRVTGKNLELWQEIWEDWRETGTLEHLLHAND